MKKAIAVIGACFGDEGKGLIVDYFCRQASYTPIVVRFNGGAQAGHTVVTPEGQRHVFHHFCAGTLAGDDSYLSKHFIINPALWKLEVEQLESKNIPVPFLFADPAALVTTPYDMYVNQKIEQSRKDSCRHGSCGVGIHETMLRSEIPFYKFTLQDIILGNYNNLISAQVHAIHRLAEAGLYDADSKNYLHHSAPNIHAEFIKDCEDFRKTVTAVKPNVFLKEKKEIIFEGAQGLLLDQDNHNFFPHVTHSKTGLHNVIEIAIQAGIERIEACYVTRSYLTRHGMGELPGEDYTLKYEDLTNEPNVWQGSLRFAPHDERLLNKAIYEDLRNNSLLNPYIDPVLAITHCDQAYFNPQIGIPIKYRSYGPTYTDVIATEIQRRTYAFG